MQFLIEIVDQIVIVRRNKMKAIPKGNKGLAKLKKVAPQVVAKMGFKKKGGLISSIKRIKRGK